MLNGVKNLLGGLFLIALISFTAIYFSEVEAVSSYGVSSLIIAIILGGLYGNTLHKDTPSAWNAGIAFSQKKLLRLGIILYGFRITFQQIANVGIDALILDVFVVTTILTIGYQLGVRVFKLDNRLSMLIACGSSICGAAAVLGAEPIVKAKPHETSVAVATVVIFGTIAMFVFPPIVSQIDMSEHQMGVALGATIHEVAQVVAGASSVSEDATSTAVIVKLVRVMLLIPVLLVLAYIFGKHNKDGEKSSIVKSIPWFAIMFVVASAINSLQVLSENIINWIIVFDNIFLTMAMAALGVETNLSKVRQVGIKPFLLAGILFCILCSYLYGPLIISCS